MPRGGSETVSAAFALLLLSFALLFSFVKAAAIHEAAETVAGQPLALRFGTPQFMGPGERPDSMLGLDSPSGERVIGSQLYGHIYRHGAWVPAAKPLPKGIALPAQCGYPCEGVQTMLDTFAPVFAAGNNLSATTFVEDRCEFEGRKTGGPGAAPCQGAVFNSSHWSAADDGLDARPLVPQPALRTFHGLPMGVVAFPCCGPNAEKYGFRLGGAISARINASYFLQTALVRFRDGRKEYNHTHIPTSVVVYASTDLVRWEYLATMANADDFPESEEGPNEMDMVVLKDGSLLAIFRLDAGDGKDHPYLPYYESRSANAGRSWSRLTPIRNAGSARPKLLVLEGAVLLSGGRFDAAVAQGIAPARRQANISDVLVWAGDENGRNWQMYSISYHHNALVGCKTLLMNGSAHGKPADQKIG
jgi:hypothetical protein